VSVIRVRIKRHVGDQHQLRNRRLDLAQRAEKKIVRGESMCAARIFLRRLDDRKNGRRRNPQIERLPAFADQIFHTPSHHSRHRSDGCVALAAMDKQRIDQIGHIEPRLADHAPQAFRAPQAPHPCA
jgi:hypothetical protein